MKLFAGIDGGQSSTTAVVGDETGAVLGRGTGPPADEVGEGTQSTRLRDALEAALAAALRDANQAGDAQLESVLAGVSGYDGHVTGVSPTFRTRHFHIVHDAPVAHAAAFGTGAGVLVIAGTGSVAYGRNDAGDTLRLGGWGYLFGDEGSAFWIGRRCIERAMHDEDAGLGSFLRAEVLQHFAQPSLRDLLHASHANVIARSDIAAFARRALELARSGNPDAFVIAGQAADALAALGAHCAQRLHGDKRVIGHPLPLAFSGGLVGDEWFAAKVHACALDRLPEAQLATMRRTPAEGALLLAIERSRTA